MKKGSVGHLLEINSCHYLKGLGPGARKYRRRTYFSKCPEIWFLRQKKGSVGHCWKSILVTIFIYIYIDWRALGSGAKSLGIIMHKKIVKTKNKLKT